MMFWWPGIPTDAKPPEEPKKEWCFHKCPFGKHYNHEKGSDCETAKCRCKDCRKDK